MGDDGFDSVSIFLTEECKQCNRWSEEVPIQNLNYAGRWTEQQWSLYVKFSLKQICENKLKTSQVKPTPAHRRPYASFDRRFVEFVEAQKRHEKLTQEQKEILRKRAKSKFNTVKRNIKGKSKRHTQKNYLEQFQQMIYQEAQKLSRTPFNKGIFQLLECYETLPRQFGNPEFSEPREHTPSRRYLTRSEENRQNQNEISQQ